MVKKNLYITTSAEMLAFGDVLSKACIGQGSWIYLSGELGMGKTTLVRGFLQGLGYTERVKSPTYTLVEPYEVQGKTIFHFDFYRINQAADLMQLGLEEYFTNTAICLVEWPDLFMDVLPTPDMIISFTKTAEQTRQLNVQSVTPRGDAIVGSLHV